MSSPGESVSLAWNDSKHALAESQGGIRVLLESLHSRQFPMFTGRKLPLTLAFAGVIGLAFGASCKGFFVDPVLTAIAVSPTAPQVETGKTINLQAFGTYDDGTRKQVKSGVSWSSSDPTVGTIDANSGVLTGGQPGTTTITASAQGLSGTANATVLLTGVSAIDVTPTSGSVTIGGSPFAFSFTATANGVSGIHITTDTGADLNISPSTTSVTCQVSGDDELCSADSNATAGTYTITMTYPGSSASKSATLNVTP